MIAIIFYPFCIKFPLAKDYLKYFCIRKPITKNITLTQMNQKNIKQKLSLTFPITFSLALLMVPLSVQAVNNGNADDKTTVAQTSTIKGHVTDENGEPLIGVTVRVVGANTLGVPFQTSTATSPSLCHRGRTRSPSATLATRLRP